MPTYSFGCDGGHLFDRYLSLDHYDRPQVCVCGKRATKIITAPILVSATPLVCYDSPITGEPITSMAARRNDMDKHNCVPYDPELKTDQARHQQDDDAALDRSVDESVRQTWSKLDTRTRGRIASDVEDKRLIPTIERVTPYP